MPYATKPTYPRHDSKCPDGFTCYGWRQSHKGGYVRFQHGRHYHEDFAQWEGLWVYVVLADWPGINVEVYTGRPFEGDALLCVNEDDWRKRHGNRC